MRLRERGPLTIGERGVTAALSPPPRTPACVLALRRPTPATGAALRPERVRGMLVGAAPAL